MNDNDKSLAIEQIAAAIAHEVKNPLTMVKANIDVLEASDGSMAHQKNYTMIRKELEKINDIMIDFIYLTRPNEYNEDIVYVYDIVSQITSNILISHEGKITINLICSRDDIAVSGSEKSLTILFNNIIKNAVEAMEGSGIINISISANKRAGNINIVVKDTGHGFSKAMGEKIFEEFFTTKSTGSGLGLSICKKIVADHKGTFSLKSCNGGGCIATVTLPVYNN